MNDAEIKHYNEEPVLLAEGGWCPACIMKLIEGDIPPHGTVPAHICLYCGFTRELPLRQEGA